MARGSALTRFLTGKEHLYAAHRPGDKGLGCGFGSQNSFSISFNIIRVEMDGLGNNVFVWHLFSARRRVLMHMEKSFFVFERLDRSRFVLAYVILWSVILLAC